jgi:hypothetical protein
MAVQRIQLRHARLAQCKSAIVVGCGHCGVYDYYDGLKQHLSIWVLISESGSRFFLRLYTARALSLLRQPRTGIAIFWGVVATDWVEVAGGGAGRGGGVLQVPAQPARGHGLPHGQVPPALRPGSRRLRVRESAHPSRLSRCPRMERLLGALLPSPPILSGACLEGLRLLGYSAGLGP